jgi:hypothetical protein
MHAIVKICNEELGHIILKYFISVEKHTIHARCPICPCGNRFMLHALFTSTTKPLHCQHIQWTLDIWCHKSQNKKNHQKVDPQAKCENKTSNIYIKVVAQNLYIVGYPYYENKYFNQITFFKMIEPIKFISAFFS